MQIRLIRALRSCRLGIQANANKFGSKQVRTIHVELHHTSTLNKFNQPLPSACLSSSSSTQINQPWSQTVWMMLASFVASGSIWLLSTSTVEAAAAPVSDSNTKPLYRTLPSSVTHAEREAVAAIRHSLLRQQSQLDSNLARYVHEWAITDDWCLLRYLRAHKLHVGNAQNGLLATASWRLIEQVDDLRVDEFADIYRQGLMHVSTSIDPVGRAIIINRKNPNPSVGWTDNIFRREIRSLVYTMERAIREMEDRVERGEIDPNTLDYKWVWVIDMGTYNSKSATPWYVTKSLIDCMRTHYPERLHLGIILDAPWILRSLLTVFKPIIPRVTRDKVLFVHDRNCTKTRDLIDRTLGGLEKLPVESNIVGAKTVFDAETYIRTDPLGQPRPTRSANSLLSNAAAPSNPSTIKSKFDSALLDKLQFWK